MAAKRCAHHCSQVLTFGLFAVMTLSSFSWAAPGPLDAIRTQRHVARDTVTQVSVNGTNTGCTPLANVALPNNTFFTFPDNYQPESIKQRTNGALLVTINSVPALYQIDPTKNQTGDILFRLNNYTSLFGLVESGTPDVFFMIANNFTGNPNFWGIQGTNSIWLVDMRGVSTTPGTPEGRQTLQTGTRVSKIVDIPEAQLLDGLTLVNPDLNLLVTGDAQLGTLWLIDVPKQKATVIYTNSTALAGTSTEEKASLAHVGINGVRFNKQGTTNSVWWTNTAKGQMWSLPIRPGNPGNITELPTLIENVGEGAYLDDFTIDQAGNVYISEPLKGLRFRPASAPLGQDSSIFINFFNVNSNTYGRMADDKCRLYVTANGRVNAQSAAPMNVPPLLAWVDISSFGVCQGLSNSPQPQSPGSAPTCPT